MLVLDVFAILFSFYLIAKISDIYFLVSLDTIAKRINLSSEAAGATLMAIGSSAPEFAITLISLLKPGNHSAIGIGTIVGSALFNILFIIGAAVLVKTAHVTWKPALRDIVFYAGTILLLFISFRDGEIIFPEALAFIMLYIGYIFSVIHWKKWFKYTTETFEILEEKVDKLTQKSILSSLTKIIERLLTFIFPSTRHYFLIFGFSLLWIGVLSWVLVESTVNIAVTVGIPEVLISLTVLAAGTSIPDTISSIIVAKQGRMDMAISNAIGSNIFNILFALGVPWSLILLFHDAPIKLDTGSLYSSTALLLGSLLFVTILFLWRKWQLGKTSGIALISLYVISILLLVYSLI